MTNPIIKEAVAATKEAIPDHYATLLGERKFGSKWGRDFTEADFELPWEETDPPEVTRMPGCRYFKLDGEAFASAFPDALLGATLLKNLPADLIDKVRIKEGDHGTELRIDLIDICHDIEYPTEAWLIVGEDNGRQVVFTAHPGPPMVPLSPETAVKIF